ncbi:MAG: aspartyl protease family protein [Candidatus Binatia bacterium]
MTSVRVVTKLQSKALLAFLLALWLALSVLAPLEASSTLSVTANEAPLYASQSRSSNILAKLKHGEKLTPLANIPGTGMSWYMVKTQSGVLGWVESSDVEGTKVLEKLFEETVPVPTLVIPPEEPSTVSVPHLDRAFTVPIEMNGSIVIVPVVLNRSLKTFMIMDTGSSFTMVTPRIAKKLRLKPLSKVSVATANGIIKVPLARLGSLKVGKSEIHGLRATVQDFSLSPRIAGLLGLNFLSRFHTSIDPRRQRLTLAPR